ncbi:MAG TPA: 2-dehydro-3-deoxyphosphogluconate aldolase [Thermoanaerobaculia bacterium]|nr:2-dehydro-3-deoxyphosphogluconate aldolase [Thermoanaerobaculia bacterium]
METTTVQTHPQIAASLRRAPVIGVVRTHSPEEAARQARLFAVSGLELIEITFTVPGASTLVRQMLAKRDSSGPPWFGMGTVTTAARAREAVQAGAEFIVTPNVSPEVAREARQAGLYLVMGALTPTEIVAARELGADLVKVYPLPPVGGPQYLSVVRQPLGDIPMLAGGGFGIEEIPAYAQAGASAFGIGGPLLGTDEEETRRRIARALELARSAGGGGRRHERHEKDEEETR